MSKKNVFLKSLLAIAISGTLTACGGGSGSDTSFSGKAADGYLVNAKVCLDANLDGVCNDNEPGTTTGTDGVFAFEATNISSSWPLLVESAAGETIDQDTGAAVLRSFSMTAKATPETFISPFSTLIYSKVASYTEGTEAEKREKAVTWLKTALGTSVDVTGTILSAKQHQTLKQVSSPSCTARRV